MIAQRFISITKLLPLGDCNSYHRKHQFNYSQNILTNRFTELWRASSSDNSLLGATGTSKHVNKITVYSEKYMPSLTRPTTLNFSQGNWKAKSYSKELWGSKWSKTFKVQVTHDKHFQKLIWISVYQSKNWIRLCTGKQSFKRAKDTSVLHSTEITPWFNIFKIVFDIWFSLHFCDFTVITTKTTQ